MHNLAKFFKGDRGYHDEPYFQLLLITVHIKTSKISVAEFINFLLMRAQKNEEKKRYDIFLRNIIFKINLKLHANYLHHISIK